jgi:hypothetical protein
MRIPFGAEVVDGRGGYLIPGLWDMHIHSVGYDYGRRHLPKLVAHGITGVRDMGTPLEDALRLRNDAWGGKILSPRLVVSGPLLNGPLHTSHPLGPRRGSGAGGGREPGCPRGRLREGARRPSPHRVSRHR